MKEYSKRKVLVLYTGGTIGMKKDEQGSLAPQSLDYMKDQIPELDELPYQVDYKEVKSYNKDKGVREFIDSSNAGPDLYNDLVNEVKDNYNEYDGFVVIFGTDTMEDAAGYLSYQLEGLGKPVIFTGSMDPASEREIERIHEHGRKPRKENDALGSDGPRNLVDAIHVAARSGYDIPQISEVSVCFYGKLFRGNRSRKYSADDRDAFDSPGQEILATIRHGEDVEEIKEKGLPTDFSAEAEIEVNEDELITEPKGKLEAHEIKPKYIFPINTCPPEVNSLKMWQAALNLRADAILIYGVDNEIKEGRSIYKIYEKMETTNIPVIYVGKEQPPTSEWSHLKGIGTLRQAMAKARYVLSRTDDPSEIKILIESNLRGEGEGPLLNESELLRERERRPEHQREMPRK